MLPQTKLRIPMPPVPPPKPPKNLRICKNCKWWKHWEDDSGDYCDEAFPTEPHSEVNDDRVGLDHWYTTNIPENFGCIHFKPKEPESNIPA